MSSKKFRAKLDKSGTGTLFEVPGTIVRALGDRKRLPVTVAINGHTYRTTVAVYGGRYFIGVSRDNRERAGVEAGQTITVTLAADSEPRTVRVPPDLAQAMRDAPKAKSFFDQLSFTHRREYVEWFTGAKRPETRTRRIERAIQDLLVGRRGR